MASFKDFLIDIKNNAYGLGENAASLLTGAIAQPVSGYAAMFDPVHGAEAIKQGMTYTPRTQAGQMYQQAAARTLGEAVKPVMPVIDTWQKGVDIAGRYSPTFGALLQTTPTALGVLMGYKPAMQTGRQISNSLGALQQRAIANASAPRTLNTGFRGQRGAVGVLDNINPTGKVFTEYDPKSRANAILAKNIVTIDKTMGGSPDDYVLVYRGAPKNQTTLNSGDFVTTNKQLAKDYAGDGVVISQKVKKSEILDDINEPLGEEYIYKRLERPLTEFEQAHLTAQRNAALPVSQGGLGLRPDNTAMDRARALGFDVDNPVYHGTGANIDAFDLSRSGSASGAEQYGTGVYTTTNPTLASGYANSTVQNANVMPLLTRMSNPISDETVKKLTKAQIKKIIEQSPDLDEQLWNYGDVGYEGKNKVLNDAVNSLYEYQGDKMLENLHPIANDFFKNNPVEFNNAAARVLKKDGVVVSFPRYNEKFNIPWNANQVRSRFAAFDPFNRDSSNLLASMPPLIGATTLGAYLYNEDKKNKNKKD